FRADISLSATLTSGAPGGRTFRGRSMERFYAPLVRQATEPAADGAAPSGSVSGIAHRPRITEIPSRSTSDLVEQLVDRLARGDRARTDWGVWRHPKRVIDRGAEDLRWDRMVLHVSADLVGRAINTAADAGACQHGGEAGRPVAAAGDAVIGFDLGGPP